MCKFLDKSYCLLCPKAVSLERQGDEVERKAPAMMCIEDGALPMLVTLVEFSEVTGFAFAAGVRGRVGEREHAIYVRVTDSREVGEQSVGPRVLLPCRDLWLPSSSRAWDAITACN